MKLLPIVGRELRESSRRQSTYWLRVRVAAQAVLVAIVAYFYSLEHRPGIKLGTALFWGVAGISMLFCLLAGRRSTADCISLEKREGTLGLLFLTDLKGYDVVLGKLVATSVTALYALLGVFPVLAVPLLTGGMTSGEGERMVVVLVNTFFLSVAIGIFASAITREYRAAMAANFLIWLALVAAPAALGVGLAMAHSGPPSPPFFYSCPIFSFIVSTDLAYATMGADFWRSVVFTHVLAWLLVLAACWIVPHTWGDKPARAPSRRWRWRDVGAWVLYGNAAGRDAFRKAALARNAYFWHAARARFKPRHVWLFIVLSGAWWLNCWRENGHMWLDEATYLATAAILNTAFKLWITVEAAHQPGEDRRSGAFELLLATPLTVEDILRGQLLALRRQFLKPLALVVVLQVIFFVTLRREHKDYAAAIMAELLLLAPDLAALTGVALLTAVRGKSQTQATVTAATRILMLPWVLFGIVRWATAALVWLDLIANEPSRRTMLAQWVGIALATDLIYGVPAWRSLCREFRRLATESLKPPSWRERFARLGVWLGAQAGRAVPARARIPVMAGLGLVATVGIVQFLRPKRVELPPPVMVTMTQSNTPLRIFPSGQQGIFMVLPDSSLWRWGAIDLAARSRAAVPEPVDDRHDWVKAAGNDLHSAGLRADGTIWEWGLSNGTNIAAPRPAISGSDWVDIGVGPPWGGSVALRGDGTIWAWGNYQPGVKAPHSNGLTRVGTESNWTAVACANVSCLGLRADGTLWVWGIVVGSRNGSMMQTNIEAPLLLCAETNWISIDSNGQARNRAGELWDVANRLPVSSARAAVVCRLISPDWAAGHIESAPYWLNCQIRANGTLWSTKVEQSQWYLPGQATTPFRQLGNRSDWVGLWGVHGTAFGLTADGTVWAWGYDVGREPVVTASSRIRLMQAVVNGQSARYGNSPEKLPPILEEPRPLLKWMNAPGR